MEQNGLYAEYDENAYMEQEEEWEREGLLDPAWEKQQKKVSESGCLSLHKENTRLSSHEIKRVELIRWNGILCAN